MLSDQKIGLLAIRAINTSGCKVIKNTAPFGTEVVPMVRHILDEYESAACAERDARIAELTQTIEDQKQTIDCLKAIINDHGPTTENVTIVGRLEQQLAEARKDAKTFTEEQIDAAVKAWFAEKIIPGRYPFSKRMRSAIDAAIKEQT